MASDLVKTPKGYIRVDLIETFFVRDSPGWRDNGHVIVRLVSGREIDSEMWESDFLKAYKEARQ